MGYVFGNLISGALLEGILAFVVTSGMKLFNAHSDTIEGFGYFIFFLCIFGTFMHDLLKWSQGRMRRLNYILSFLTINIVNSVIFNLLTEIKKIPIGAMLSTLLIYLFFANFAISSARFRDINSNPHFALLLLIPFVNLLVLLALCFIPGTPGKNQYGDNPKLKGVEPPQSGHNNPPNSSSD